MNNKRVYKYQVIAKLEEMGYERTHTLRKTHAQVNGIVRRGWFVATLHGWKYLGSTLSSVIYNLGLRRS